MPTPLKDKGLGELQTFLNRLSRAYSSGKISLQSYQALHLKTTELIETLRGIEETPSEESGE
jgi:hypothetical protein